jgi:hypothetical protein
VFAVLNCEAGCASRPLHKRTKILFSWRKILFVQSDDDEYRSVFEFNLDAGLLIVGPARSEWNVLRATDGERFVVTDKGHDFSGEFVN